MHVVVTIIHIFVCIILILVVLLQAGRGANMGAIFGGSSQTIFGTSGPGTFLGKVTTVVAIIFMLTSLSLTYFSLQNGPSPALKKANRAPIERPVPAPSAPPAAAK